MGKRKREVFDEDADDEDAWLYNIVLAMSGDATDHRDKSITPILIRVLSWAPWIRDDLDYVIMTLLLPEVCLELYLFCLSDNSPHRE